MLVLVNGYSPGLDRYRNVGGLIQPRNWALADPWIARKRMWAIDNDCFNQFDADAYIRILAAIRGKYYEPTMEGCLFVTLPDVVADAKATRELWDAWWDDVRAYDMPLAFVAQDGITSKMVPWDQMHALFLGGTTAWKLGPEAAYLTKLARRLYLWVHMGRVNSRRRLRYAASIGCNSVDGTGFSRFRDSTIPWAEDEAQVQQGRLLL